jgi:hypothetical protein
MQNDLWTTFKVEWVFGVAIAGKIFFDVRF